MARAMAWETTKGVACCALLRRGFSVLRYFLLELVEFLENGVASRVSHRIAESLSGEFESPMDNRRNWNGDHRHFYEKSINIIVDRKTVTQRSSESQSSSLPLVGVATVDCLACFPHKPNTAS